MTRSLSTSLALTMLLATGTAMAAPASQDNAMQRAGKSLTASAHYFASDLKARNEKAGPGLLKRTMTKLGANVDKLVLATKQGIAATRSSMAQSRAERIAYKAADKDFNSWLDEKGNEDAKTYYRGAAKDAGVGTAKFMKGFGTTSTVALGAASVAYPGFVVLAAGGAAGTKEWSAKVQVAKRTAAERTIGAFADKVPAERLASWSKASYIGAELAK